MARWKLDVQAQRMNEWKKGKKVWKPPMALTELYLIWFDLIWFYFIWFDLIWFDLIWWISLPNMWYYCWKVLDNKSLRVLCLALCGHVMMFRYDVCKILYSRCIGVCVCVCVCVRHSWLRCASLSGILSLSLVQYKLIKGAVSSVDADFHFMGLRDGCWQRKSDWIDFVLIVIRSFGFHNHTWRRCVSD